MTLDDALADLQDFHDERLISKQYNELMINLDSRENVKSYLQCMSLKDLGGVLTDVQKEKVKCIKLVKKIDQFLLMGKLMYQSFGQNIPKSMVFDTLGSKTLDSTSPPKLMRTESLATPSMNNLNLMSSLTLTNKYQEPRLNPAPQVKYHAGTLKALGNENTIDQGSKQIFSNKNLGMPSLLDLGMQSNIHGHLSLSKSQHLIPMNHNNREKLASLEPNLMKVQKVIFFVFL